MSKNEIILEAIDITKKLSDKVLINELNFIMKKGEKIAFVGETGSGKTSILKIIGGLIQPDSGMILFKNEKIKGPNETLIPGHKKIAYLSQHFELWNNYYVHELLSYANELSESKSEALYKICQIEHLLNRYSDELSGGEKQRVALAALLTRSPELLLLDEPFSNLDSINKRIIKKVLNEITEEFDLDCILISHDASDILSWANKVIILKSGKIIQMGTPQEIYHFPKNEYCAELLGKYFLLSHTELIYSSSYENKNAVKTICRPEYVSISEKNSLSIDGIIKHVEFFGHHYILEVQYKEILLQVSAPSTNKTYEVGENIYLTINKVIN